MLWLVRSLRFRVLEHVADCRILVWGEDEQALIAHAVAATLRHALGVEPRAPAQQWHPVLPWPSDLAERLVHTVNEALFLLYTHRRVTTSFELRGGDGWIATAPLGKRSICREIKAATFHALHPTGRRGKLSATLTLDL